MICKVMKKNNNMIYNRRHRVNLLSPQPPSRFYFCVRKHKFERSLSYNGGGYSASCRLQRRGKGRNKYRRTNIIICNKKNNRFQREEKQYQGTQKLLTTSSSCPKSERTSIAQTFELEMMNLLTLSHIPNSLTTADFSMSKTILVEAILASTNAMSSSHLHGTLEESKAKDNQQSSAVSTREVTNGQSINSSSDSVSRKGSSEESAINKLPSNFRQVDDNKNCAVSIHRYQHQRIQYQHPIIRSRSFSLLGLGDNVEWKHTNRVSMFLPSYYETRWDENNQGLGFGRGIPLTWDERISS